MYLVILVISLTRPIYCSIVLYPIFSDGNLTHTHILGCVRKIIRSRQITNQPRFLKISEHYLGLEVGHTDMICHI